MKKESRKCTLTEFLQNLELLIPNFQDKSAISHKTTLHPRSHLSFQEISAAVWSHVSGQTVGLQASSLLHLLEIERVFLQRTAQANLASADLGTIIRIPKGKSSSFLECIETSSRKSRQLQISEISKLKDLQLFSFLLQFIDGDIYVDCYYICFIYNLISSRYLVLWPSVKIVRDCSHYLYLYQTTTVIEYFTMFFFGKNQV